MEGQAKRGETGQYEAAIDTATLMASEGHYDLALQVVQRTLERLYLERETAEVASLGSEEKLKEIEALLTKKYMDFRAKLEGRERPYRKTFINTLIISGTVSIAIIITVSIVTLQIKSLVNNPVEKLIGGFHETLRSELPRLTDTVRQQVPGIAQKIRDEIPQATRSLTKITDEKISGVINKRVDEVLDKKLPGIVDEKIRNMSREGKGKTGN